MNRALVCAFAIMMARCSVAAQDVRGEVRLRGAPLVGAVVYLERLGDSVAPPPPATGRMDQRELRFVPRVLVVSPGSMVEFPNSDLVMHNVFHPGDAESSFDLGTYPASELKTLRFDRPGLFVILCHVHPEMVGYVAVVPSSWHSVTEESGRFTIERAPPGKYRIHVWHRRANDPAQNLSVPASGLTEPVVLQVERRGRHGKDR